MQGKSALLFGATGLIGGQLLSLLLEDSRYERVHVFTRRELDISHEKLYEHLIDFSRLEDYEKLIRGDELYCCLGTTMSKAGSKAAFREVDYHYPMKLAKMASKNKVKKYIIISSIGADTSSLFFYSRVKGEMERGVVLFPFEQVGILRPSLLLGSRDEKRKKENTGKALNKIFSPLLVGPIRKYRGIHGETVAKAMIEIANQIYPEGKNIFESDELEELGGLEKEARS